MASAPRNRFRALELEVDLANGEIRRNGEPVALPPRALELLELLVRRAGELVSRDDIRRALWKDGVFVDFDRSVNIYVNQLRAAFGDDARSPRYIETLPRRGYRFIAPVERPEEEPSSAEAGRSIAILPFFNTEGHEDLEHLCEGISEDVLNGLGRVPGLRIASRTSSFRFKNVDMDARELGRALGVESILEGSVRRVGDRLRVSTQLVSARDGYCMWSRRYDRGLGDVFEIEDDIARGIVGALRLQLVGDLLPRSRGTGDPAAYNLYLRARHNWYQRYSGGIERAIDYFQRAVGVDPAYTSAYAGLADCHVVLGIYGFLPPQVAHDQARAAAEQALSIDPEHPAALGSRGAVHFFYEWNWTEAERMLRQATELEPTHLELCTTYSLVLSFLNRLGPAMEVAQQAQRIDPLSPYGNSMAAVNHLMWGDSHVARVLCDRALEVEPDFLLALNLKAAAFARSGELAEALALLRRIVRRTNRAAYALGWLGWALAMAGEREEAEEVREEMIARLGSTYVPSLFIAWVDAALGDAADARRRLEEAVREHHPMLILHHLPVNDPLKDDPAARALLSSVLPA